MLFAAIILILLAILIKFGKMHFLVAGYNALSREQKKIYDIKRIANWTSCYLFFLGIILIIGYFIERKVGANKWIDWIIFSTVLFGFIQGILIYKNSVSKQSKNKKSKKHS